MRRGEKEGRPTTSRKKSAQPRQREKRTLGRRSGSAIRVNGIAGGAERKKKIGLKSFFNRPAAYR